MHRWLYAAAPLLAGSLTMNTVYAASMFDFCDRKATPVASGSDFVEQNEARVCPVCRMHPAASHAGESAPLQGPLWNHSLPVTATYTSAAPGADVSVVQSGEGPKMCLACHDGTMANAAIVAGVTSGTTGRDKRSADGDRKQRASGNGIGDDQRAVSYKPVPTLKSDNAGEEVWITDMTAPPGWLIRP